MEIGAYERTSYIHIQLITNTALERHRTYFREETWNAENVGQLLDIEFLGTEIPYCSLGQRKVNIYATRDCETRNKLHCRPCSKPSFTEKWSHNGHN